MKNKRFSLYCVLPDSEQEILLRSDVGREEVDRLVEILVKVSRQFYGYSPRKKGDTWYVASLDWRKNGSKLCWIEQEQ